MQTPVDVIGENEYLKSQVKELRNENIYLKEQNKLLNLRLFGRKTEKSRYNENDQLGLFDDLELIEQPVHSADDKITINEHKRYKRGRKAIPEDIPRREIIHEIPEKDKICSCCNDPMTHIGYTISEELDIVPAKIEVILNKREKYACKNKKCERTPGEQPIKVASPANKIVPKSSLSNNSLAYIINSKFEDANPFYRLEKMTSRYGFTIPRSTMSSLAVKVSVNLEPIDELLRNELLKSPLIGIDETTLQVICEDDKPPDSKSYMWVFRGEIAGNPLIYFQYSPSRSGDIPLEILSDYRGRIQTDDYAGYNKLAKKEGISHFLCMAHGRRPFMELKKVSKNHEGAKYVLGIFSKLYKIEEMVRKKRLTPGETYLLRQKESVPLLEEFKTYLDKKKLTVLPGCDHGKAINYMLSNWEKLSAYANDGFVPIDNNLVENSIRPFVIGRKNWLFNFTGSGAKSSALFYSLIETAKACKIEPYSYLCYLFNEFPKAKKDQYAHLLPMNVDVNKVKPYIKPKRYK